MSDKISAIASVKSDSRTSKIDTVLPKRQPGLAVVVENVHDPHNFNAILRSCDAVGAMRCCLIYTIEKAPRLAHTSSSGAYKWIEIERYDSVEKCFEALHSDGFQILATRIDKTATSLYHLDLTTPTAFVLGNEHRGVSEEVLRFADRTVYIPMMGMTESVNVSVASAVCLFEAMRQRLERGMYETPQLSAEALRSKRLEWLTEK